MLILNQYFLQSLSKKSQRLAFLLMKKNLMKIKKRTESAPSGYSRSPRLKLSLNKLNITIKNCPPFISNLWLKMALIQRSNLMSWHKGSPVAERSKRVLISSASLQTNSNQQKMGSKKISCWLRVKSRKDSHILKIGLWPLLTNRRGSPMISSCKRKRRNRSEKNNQLDLWKCREQLKINYEKWKDFEKNLIKDAMQ